MATSTGDTVTTTGSTLAETFALPSTLTTTAGLGAIPKTGVLIASTPLQAEDDLEEMETLRGRTRSGMVRTSQPRKRSRTPRTGASTIATIGEERTQVSWCPITYTSAEVGAGPSQNIYGELGNFNINNLNISQRLPYAPYASASFVSAPYSTAANTTRYSMGLSGFGNDAGYMRPQYSWAGRVGGLSGAINNSAFIPGVGSLNTGGIFSTAGLHGNLGLTSSATPFIPHTNQYASTANVTPHHLSRSSFSDITLSTSQVATRQVMSKDLPTFSGNPEEWPVFITNFEQSTERCGFTEQENLIRLQKCLKGPALEAVRGKLMMPSTVFLAIDTLRMLYGRPDVIHHTLQRKLRQHPIVKMERMETLINFALSVQNYRATMQAIGLCDYLNDPMLINELLTKLPSELKLDWGRHRLTHMRVDLALFDEWLFNLATCASQVTPFCNGAGQTEVKGSNRRNERLMVHDVVDQDKGNSCPKCGKDHRLSDCAEFRALSRDARWRMVRESKLCICCFKRHFVRRCNSNKQCGIDGCKMRHNPLLHGSTQNRTNASEANEGNKSTNVMFHAKNAHALFRYVPVILYNNNRSIDTFAFIDEGSACTLIENDVIDELGIDGPKQELCLQWTGDILQSEANSRCVSIHISGQRQNAKRLCLQKVRTVSKLNLPVQTLEISTINERQHLRNLPISPYKEVRARILIGLDNLKLGVPLEIREGKGDDLVAAKCKLGWSVYGRKAEADKPISHVMHICHSDDRLEELVKSHFSLEAIGTRPCKPLLSKENERCQRIMDSMTRYLPEEKRWETGLLWKHDHIELPNSLPMAYRRCLENKMVRDPSLKSFLVDTISDYERKHYIRKTTKEENLASSKSWYIPIFTVTNINKNKRRLVWDAAAAVNNVALNSVLLKGPDLCRSLVGVLMRFRERPIALSGDIREMFHQIRICVEDQVAQKFLWRDGDATRDPDTYVMQVMTFGASCSPSLANFVKDKNALRFQDAQPVAVRAILENTYVDDWLQSTTSVDEMIRLATKVRDIHADGGFEMRNWISNSREVLFALTSQSTQGVKHFEQADARHEKVLGMWWFPSDDTFSFFKNFPKDVLDESAIPSKRQILRVIMTVFDPLGLLGFFMIYAKILMQEVWRSGVQWDEPVHHEEADKWFRWVRHLRNIPEIRVPRCFPLVSCSEDLQMHIFVDASIDAYAAVVYLRAKRGSNVSCSLVASKTRVAPLKPVSIPRLELIAAILGLRLCRFVASELSVTVDRRAFWSDSKNVLFWIRSDARKFQQFVAVRVGEILEDSRVEEWRWVPSADNVADEGTKWAREPEFSNTNRWFTGPPFLLENEEKWPPQNLDGKCETEMICHMEVRPPIQSPLVATIPDPSRISTWEKLRGAQSYILRFLRNISRVANVSSRFKRFIGEADVEAAEFAIIRCCQGDAYGSEIKDLKSGKAVARDSTLFRCSPYLDDLGLLRVRGRIDMAENVAFEVKRPIILPRHSRITQLIVDFYHRQFHHHHNEIVVNEMRQRYFVPALRAMVRETTKACQWCKNRRAAPMPPEMGDLPKERLAIFSRPFTNTGIDFFGPFEVVVGRRREKRWGVLFTCLTVRAVHIELSSSLSTDSFLLILKQFMARRGVPKCIWTDNGTNFRGASRVLEEEIQRLSCGEVERRHPKIKWHFIPPVSPHMGGSWERMVRSVKSILMDILNTNNLREESLRATLADIEHILNSRPLTYLPLDTPEMEALTPNHFLVGSSSGICVNDESERNGRALNKTFRISNQIADQFWRRWIREYLPTLTRRAKWFVKSPDPIVLNDIVIIVDNNAKRNIWRRGLVVDVHPGKDGEVRSAVVKTADGLVTRPTVKLAKLDVKK